MREKILLTLGECTDEDGFVLPDLAVPKLEALFTAETVAMREALAEARTEIAYWIDREGWSESSHNVIAKIDTVLKGGK